MLRSLPECKLLKIKVSNAIATVTIDNPPLNLLDAQLIEELDRLGQWLVEDEQLKVVIFDSANPDFFIAHADLRMLDGMPTELPGSITGPSYHQSVVDRFQRLPQVTIGKIRGIARGGGSEFLLALDLRFGALEGCVFGQPEVALGFPPGCGATQRLPRLVGRAHAIEVIMSACDVTAERAERIGWLNRALPDDELDAYIEDFAARVETYPMLAIREAKRAIDATQQQLDLCLATEFSAFLTAFGADEARRRVRRAMDLGFQTHACESRSLDQWLISLAELETFEANGSGSL